ncbi:hypothetical protein MKEN_01167100 [Mycena kentingensis (nom. inval.)]|nr:hypothetical protein MKEN_01167100 [Mycena kentingensis (nom. inval.)]
MPTRLRKRYLKGAATARLSRHAKNLPPEVSSNTIEILSDGDSDDEVTTWQGGVSHHTAEWTDDDWEWDEVGGAEAAEDESGDSDIEVLDDEEQVAALEAQMRTEIATLDKLGAWGGIMKPRTAVEWKKADVRLGRSVYSKGNPGESTLRRHRKEAAVKAAQDKVTREGVGARSFKKHFGIDTPDDVPTAPATPSSSSSAPLPAPPPSLWTPLPDDILTGLGGSIDIAKFLQFTTSHPPAPPAAALVPLPPPAPSPASAPPDSPLSAPVDEYFVGGYASDFDDEVEDEEEERDASITVSTDSTQPPAKGSIHTFFKPAAKRRKLDVPVRQARAEKAQARKQERINGLDAIERLIVSRKTEFQAGNHGLQARRARCIQSCLHMILNNGRGSVDASERAAEANGFSKDWGGRLVRIWVHAWLAKRELPMSNRGRYKKTQSILDVPAVRDELASYLRSHKWATDPAQLAEFFKTRFVTPQTQAFLRNLVEDEIPRALRAYVQNTLFPRIGVKTGLKQTISLSTAREWMAKFGWKYQEHKKALYFDGHERPDVVEYRQKEFIPKLRAHRARLVEYVVGEVDRLVQKGHGVAGTGSLVLCSHDEMTCQAHDGKAKSWGPAGEQPLRKKGKGRGLHYSGVIASTCGHLKDAGQVMEYGKNYDGYWNGELFVKQLKEKIIPAFEAAHGPGYQALFLIDNSQGHSAYSEDALLAQRMNLNPGGKQARMRAGWPPNLALTGLER